MHRQSATLCAEFVCIIQPWEDQSSIKNWIMLYWSHTLLFYCGCWTGVNFRRCWFRLGLRVGRCLRSHFHRAVSWTSSFLVFFSLFCSYKLFFNSTFIFPHPSLPFHISIFSSRASSRVHNVVWRCHTCLISLIIIFVLWISFYIINTTNPSNTAGQSVYKKCNYWSKKSKTSKQIEQVNVLHLLNCVSEIGIYCFYLKFIYKRLINRKIWFVNIFMVQCALC
jgi:hypothetical protein